MGSIYLGHNEINQEQLLFRTIHSFLFRNTQNSFQDFAFYTAPHFEPPNPSCRCQSQHKHQSLFNPSNHPWQHQAGCNWEPLPPNSFQSNQEKILNKLRELFCQIQWSVAPISSSILFCTAKGQHVPKGEPNQRLSRVTHSLVGRLAQVRHT